MGSTLSSHESEKGAQNTLTGALRYQKTRDPDPSSYFPNCFSRHFGE
jgi:hypothetical protein